MENKILKKAVITGIALAVSPLSVLAAGNEIPMLTNIIDTAFYITGGCIVVGLVIVGTMFLTSGGEPEKINKAKKGLVWLIIGTVIYFGVQIIKNVIMQTIGV